MTRSVGQHLEAVTAQYDGRATEFSERYESLEFEEVHSEILDLLPGVGSLVLDVGAGSGRDAAALATLGYQVVAVEPSRDMRRVGRRLHPNASIQWVNDSLPSLSTFADDTASFDFILVSAVWMHLRSLDRPRALSRLHDLVRPGGLVVVTLRLGQPDKSRHIYSVSVREVLDQAANVGLKTVRLASSRDRLGRADVHWSTVVFQRA